MKKSLFALLALSALAATPALAEESATPAPAPAEQTAAAPAASQAVRVRTRQTIYAADQTRLGQVDRLSERSAFVAVSGSRLIAVPLSSISRQDNRLVTSLTREQLLGN